jgi:hypothetical protein
LLNFSANSLRRNGLVSRGRSGAMASARVINLAMHQIGTRQNTHKLSGQVFVELSSPHRRCVGFCP